MNQPKDNLEIELWAHDLRRRWWRAAFAPFGELLSTAAHDLLRRLQATGLKIKTAMQGPINW